MVAAYGLGMVFSLRTHRELYGAAEHAESGAAPWSLGLALGTLAGVTVLVALVSEVFVASVQKAAAFGVTPAFVGLLVLLSCVLGPAPMSLEFWPGAATWMMVATLTATLVTNSAGPRAPSGSRVE